MSQLIDVLYRDDTGEIKFPTVIARDGEYKDFDHTRIYNAIKKVFEVSPPKYKSNTADSLTDTVLYMLTFNPNNRNYVGIETIQDTVERALDIADETVAAKAYREYRAKRAAQRKERPVPPAVKAAFDESSQFFKNPLQQFVFFNNYSRFDNVKGRRETWLETVERVVNELRKLSNNQLPDSEYEEISKYIARQEVMPSMRLMAMAGRGLNPIGLYNCSYGPVADIYTFVEAMIISMAGCGVGFSVEKEYVEQLPPVKRQRKNFTIKPEDYLGLYNDAGFLEYAYNEGYGTFFTKNDKGQDALVVGDSAEGWAVALHILVQLWFSGKDVLVDFSRIRAAGTPLSRKGGSSSGPQALIDTLSRIKKIILNRQGQKLTTLDAHDIMCHVANAAVSGGVRRAAQISLFDFDDQEMLTSKAPGFDIENPQRWNANNSVVWPADRELTQAEILNQFQQMFQGGENASGEPGIFSRRAAYNHLPARREKYYLDEDGEAHLIKFGTNPLTYLAA